MVSMVVEKLSAASLAEVPKNCRTGNKSTTTPEQLQDHGVGTTASFVKMVRGINFRPARVHQTVTRMLQCRTLTEPPCWYDIVGQFPPGEFLTRTQPIQHQAPAKGSRKTKIRKPSKLFKPQVIEYEEDNLRSEFFQDHPWELARPRIVVEHDGRDGQTDDWSHIKQARRPLTGESVVQRQLWLMHNVPGISKAAAYDTARKEFYALRQEEEIEKRIQREEALWMGAYFGKGPNEVAMMLEDRVYERWKKAAELDLNEEAIKREAGQALEIAAAPEEEDAEDALEPL